MPIVRAKFKCNYKSTALPGEYPGVKVSFNPVGPSYDGKGGQVWPADSDNQKFWEASPSGELTLWVKNQAAVDQFESGKEYYIDFTPA